MGFDEERVNVRCFGVGGGRLRPDPKRCVLNWLGQELSSYPTIVFIHLGENDVRDMDAQEIVSALTALLQYIAAVCRPAVIICSELVPFPAFEPNRENLMRPVNDCLKAALAGMTSSVTRFAFWKHEIGMWSPDANSNIFDHDRVHLNYNGMRRYYSSVRAAVQKSIRDIHFH